MKDTARAALAETITEVAKAIEDGATIHSYNVGGNSASGDVTLTVHITPAPQGEVPIEE